MQRPSPNDPCWCGSGTKYKKCHRDDDAKGLRTTEAAEQSKRVGPFPVSPPRTVPDEIVKPDYATRGGRPGRPRGDMRTPAEIEKMRRAGRAAAEVLVETAGGLAVGVTTDALDAIAHEAYIRRGGYPSTLGYHGFPKSLCTSVNEVICHGIPDQRPLEDGDIVNLDITIFLDGVHGDCSATYAVGRVDAESQRLMRVTHECLMRGIEAVRPGRPISDIGRAIETHAHANRFSVVRAYCGHGIGPTFHTGLQIPHFYDPAASTVMEPGMTFTIEPMLSAGDWRHRVWDDGWTAVTIDGKRSAQYEHTLLVTERGSEILTQAPQV
ncbi:MAG: type I methionyl aminopeptidase [Myxococcaceae bacterium]